MFHTNILKAVLFNPLFPREGESIDLQMSNAVWMAKYSPCVPTSFDFWDITIPDRCCTQVNKVVYLWWHV